MVAVQAAHTSSPNTSPEGAGLVSVLAVRSAQVLRPVALSSVYHPSHSSDHGSTDGNLQEQGFCELLPWIGPGLWVDPAELNTDGSSQTKNGDDGSKCTDASCCHQFVSRSRRSRRSRWFLDARS